MLARIVHSAMSAMPNWQIVSDSEVREVSQPLAGMSEAERMRQLGAMVYADAVIVPRVRRYRERVGDEWGAKSPASVSFVLDLVDVRRGDHRSTRGEGRSNLPAHSEGEIRGVKQHQRAR